MYAGTGRAFRLTPKLPPAADLDGDCRVSASDIAVVIQSWGPATPGGDGPTADLNGDGEVNGSDLGLVLSGWTG